MPSAASALEGAMAGGMASGGGTVGGGGSERPRDPDAGALGGGRRPRTSGGGSVGSGSSVTLPDWGNGASSRAPHFAQPLQSERDRAARSQTAQSAAGPGASRPRPQTKRREQSWRPPFSSAVSTCSFRKSESGVASRAGRVRVPEEVQRVAREHQPVLNIDLVADD